MRNDTQLPLHKFGIVAVRPFHKLLMPALLDYAAPVHDADRIGSAYRGETVRDDDGCALPGGQEALERPVHDPLALAVQRAGGLVQQQQPRRARQGPGDGEALLLAAREPDVPSEADVRVVLIRQRHDEVVGIRHLGRLHREPLARVLAPVADRIDDGAACEHGLLVDEPDLRAQPRHAEIREVAPVELDGAAVGVVEPQQQAHNGALASATWTNESNKVAGAHRQRQRPVDHEVGPGRVTEVDLPKLELAHDLRWSLARSCIQRIDPRPRVEQREDAVRSGATVGGLVDPACELGDPARSAHQHEQGQHGPVRRHSSPVNKLGAEHDGARVDQEHASG
mmetsp:Transcript_9798/g.27416  ORF Transcript_9798/g.27416 Transcript_9798/m.27416 type:complete len:339 (-) Transcript_9798:248-1264(-)